MTEEFKFSFQSDFQFIYNLLMLIMMIIIVSIKIYKMIKKRKKLSYIDHIPQIPLPSENRTYTSTFN